MTTHRELFGTFPANHNYPSLCGIESTKAKAIDQVSQAEQDFGYFVTAGRYLEITDQFDKEKPSSIDDLWLERVCLNPLSTA